jgi:hypothetical protein
VLNRVRDLASGFPLDDLGARLIVYPLADRPFGLGDVADHGGAQGHQQAGAKG